MAENRLAIVREIGDGGEYALVRCDDDGPWLTDSMADGQWWVPSHYVVDYVRTGDGPRLPFTLAPGEFVFLEPADG